MGRQIIVTGDALTPFGGVVVEGSKDDIDGRKIARKGDKVKVVLPLRLTQTQVDMLVEASVPDHVLGHIETNKPRLLLAIPEREQYARVGKHLEEARKLGLSGMQDIVNYICAGLIYGSQMQESSAIEALLGKVRARQISLAQALEQFP